MGDPAAVDELVVRIDARGLRRWDVYRGMATQTDAEGVERKVWIAVVDDGHYEEIHHDLSLYGALSWAANVKLLPVVPRRPQPRSYTGPTKATDCRQWIVHIDGRPEGWFSTKKAAAEAMDRAIQRDADELREWLLTWGDLVDRGTEGVDFRWPR